MSNSVLALHRPTQRAARRDGVRVFKQFTWLEVGLVNAAWSRPADRLSPGRIATGIALVKDAIGDDDAGCQSSSSGGRDSCMDKGDVFRVAGKEFMYIAEAVAPSGTVYARKFDLYQGAHGELESLQSNTEVRILFNTFKPEHDEGWEYCEIIHAVEWGNETEWFEAKAFGAERSARIAQTPVHHFIRGEPLFGMQDDKNKTTHRKLVDKLLADGWEGA